MPHLVPMPHPTSRGVGKLRRRGRPVPPLLFPSDVHIRASWCAKFPLAPKPQWHWFRHLRATSSGAFIRHQNIPELYEHRRELIIVLGRTSQKLKAFRLLVLLAASDIQYAAEAYRLALARSGVSASMSRKGDCWDNAPMESLFHTLKTERVHHRAGSFRAGIAGASTGPMAASLA